MTHSGGQPHNVGDRGQRYEVRCRNLHGDNTEATFGWSGTLEGAAAMVQSIELHPSWHSPEVHDRHGDPFEYVVPLDFVKSHGKGIDR